MKNDIKYKILILVLTVLITLLHYFGGAKNSPVHNFYRILYFIPIILAAFKFGFRGGVIESIIVSVVYSPYILLSLGKISLEMVSELSDVILFFIVGIITGTLVEKKKIAFGNLDSELKRYVLLENYTNSIVESIKTGLVAVNNDMLITKINQTAIELLKIDINSIGQNLTEIFTCCEDVKKMIFDFLSNSSNKTLQSIETELNQDSNKKIIKVSVYPLTLENIRRGLVILFEDITEFKLLQQQVLRSDKLSALGELSVGIAHEIRNPLGIIKAIEQTMKRELSENHEAIRELEIIDEEIERANKFVKALMEFGKPSKSEFNNCSLSSTIEDVLTITNKYIMQHNVNVVFNKPHDLDIDNIYADKELLKQVFINIIFNGVQAMPNGGTLTISIINFNNNFIKLIFEDTGIGIFAENIEKIFNPFFTTKDYGTGLGLSIVQRIIDEHKGTINVSSKVGNGSRFDVIIPKFEGR